MTRQDFINQIAPAIREAGMGIYCTSAIIGMACLESNFGNSSLASKYHNYFGMKCGSSWKGASVNMKTSEYINDGYVSIKDNFRVYNSLVEGVQGFFDFIQYQRYSNLKDIKEPRQFLEMIVKDGYCTSPTYTQSVLSIIERYDLRQYDSDAVRIAPADGYIVGKNYKMLYNLNCRTAPSVYASKVGYNNLTADGKAHDLNKNGALEAGTVITCLEVKEEGCNLWLRIPSGWVCAKYGEEYYII